MNKNIITRRTIGSNKVSVPLLGCGGMRFPTFADGTINFPEAVKIIDRAMSAGVNYFDTGWMYHDGRSERFFAEALASYPRESYFLADKLPAWCLTEEMDENVMFAEQLARCRTSYFDFYLLHAIDEGNWKRILDRDLLTFMKKLKESGRIRHMGFSFHGSPELLREVVKTADWDFAQIQLNAMDWNDTKAGEQYNILAEHNIPAVIMEPVRGGALAAFVPEAEAKLKSLHPDWSIASWSIRFAASLPNVMTVLSGMSNLEQIDDNIATMTGFVPLTPEEREALMEAVAENKKIVTVPCTACRYCSDCPKGIDIPGIFNLYNRFRLSGFRGGFAGEYAKLPEEKKAGNCIECGICAGHCPQHIAIPEKLKEIRQEMLS